MFSYFIKQTYKSTKKMFAVTLAALLILVSVPSDADAIVSSTAAIQLSYVVGESVAVSGVPPSLTFSGAPTPATGTLTSTITWVLLSTRVRVDSNLFFASPTAAMTDGAGHNIPSSQVYENLDGGTFGACNSSPFADTSSVAVTGATCPNGVIINITGSNLSGSQNDSYVLQLQGLSGSLPAGTYTGQINLVAGAS